MKRFKEFQDELQEFTVGKREKKTASDRMAQKRDYRKNRAKKIQQMKKYRKSAAYKVNQRKSKVMAKRGKTATGRDISVRGGSGAAQRAKEKKAELKK